jgi:hypothetical protein
MAKMVKKKHWFVLLIIMFAAQSLHSFVSLSTRWISSCLWHTPSHGFTADGNTTDSVQFIRELNINAALQSSANNLYNITKQEELSHFTSHLICVSACIALHAAGINSLNIKHALH